MSSSRTSVRCAVVRVTSSVVTSFVVAAVLAAGSMAADLSSASAEVKACTPNVDQVAIFEYPNYGGACVVKGVGAYGSAASFAPLPDESASSILVGANVIATLFTEQNGAGERQTFFDSLPDFWHNAPIRNDVMSSFLVESPGSCRPTADQVAIFEHPHFGGACVIRGTGSYNEPSSFWPLPDERASSVWVGRNVRGILFREPGLGGEGESFNFPEGDFNNHSQGIGNDRMSSFKVEPKNATCTPNDDQVAIYEGPNFTGTCVVKGVGSYGWWPNFPPLHEDNASSIRVGARVKATLYVHNGFAGGQETFARNDADFSDNVIQDIMSSFKVDPRPVPAAPTGLSATAISPSQIRFTWTDSSLDEDGFRLSDGTQTETPGANSTAFTWNGLAPGTSKCATVLAFNAAGESPATPPACATTPSPPAAPTGLSATPVSGTAIQVTWTDASTNEDGFRIFDESQQFTTLAANSTSFTWGGLSLGTSKCFTVVAYNGVGSSPSPTACAMTPTMPAAPTGLAATAVSGSAIRVTWTDASPNEEGFVISDGFTTASQPANATSYTWEGLAQGTTRCFTVQSYNLAGSSPWPARVCTTTPTVPAAPTGQSATVVSDTTIRLTWTDASTNETGFRFTDGMTAPVALPANTTSVTWNELLPGTVKCGQVQSFNLAGASPWTPMVCAWTPGGMKGE